MNAARVDARSIPRVRGESEGWNPQRDPLPVTSPDSRIIPTFVITGDKPAAVSLPLTGEAQNATPG